MSKATSPLILGDFWLDKRRDGKSPEIWQIAFVRAGTNSITYKTTKTRDLKAATKEIEAYYFSSINGARSTRAEKLSNPMAVAVIPHLYRYWEQHGHSTITAETILRHLREFKAFLEQDSVGHQATSRTSIRR